MEDTRTLDQKQYWQVVYPAAAAAWYEAAEKHSETCKGNPCRTCERLLARSRALSLKAGPIGQAQPGGISA